MTRNHSRLRNFVKKFIETVRFGNDHFGVIMGYEDYVIGDNVISRVYYVDGLGHNLFSIGQFCDSDLKVTFRKHSCYVRDTNDVELIKGSRGSNLYTILVEDMIKSSPICLLSKASKNKSWLWHRLLNHLNFYTINDLACKDLVRGLPRLKFEKDHLEVKFLRSKDDTPEFVTKFLSQVQVGLNKNVRFILTDSGTEFVNQVLTEFNEKFGPAPLFLTPGQISSGLVPNPVLAAPYVPLKNKELEILFQPMFDVYLEPPRVERPVSPTTVVQVPVISVGTTSSATIDQDAPSSSHLLSSLKLQPPISHQEPSSEASTSEDINSAESIHVT
nr:integrase, catalytic region, zinc finger, CCHC-type, peptidase aspartic, catalytic [Tanacetum cinerariifolium]